MAESETSDDLKASCSDNERDELFTFDLSEWTVLDDSFEDESNYSVNEEVDSQNVFSNKGSDQTVFEKQSFPNDSVNYDVKCRAQGSSAQIISTAGTKKSSNAVKQGDKISYLKNIPKSKNLNNGLKYDYIGDIAGILQATADPREKSSRARKKIANLTQKKEETKGRLKSVVTSASKNCTVSPSVSRTTKPFASNNCTVAPAAANLKKPPIEAKATDRTVAPTAVSLMMTPTIKNGAVTTTLINCSATPVSSNCSAVTKSDAKFAAKNRSLTPSKKCEKTITTKCAVTSSTDCAMKSPTVKDTKTLTLKKVGTAPSENCTTISSINHNVTAPKVNCSGKYAGKLSTILVTHTAMPQINVAATKSQMVSLSKSCTGTSVSVTLSPKWGSAAQPLQTHPVSDLDVKSHLQLKPLKQSRGFKDKEVHLKGTDKPVGVVKRCNHVNTQKQKKLSGSGRFAQGESKELFQANSSYSKECRFSSAVQCDKEERFHDTVSDSINLTVHPVRETVSNETFKNVLAFQSSDPRADSILVLGSFNYGLRVGCLLPSDVDKIWFKENIIKKADAYTLCFATRESGILDLFFLEEEGLASALNQIRKTKTGLRHLCLSVYKVSNEKDINGNIPVDKLKATMVFDQNFATSDYLSFHKAPGWLKPKANEFVALHNIPEGIPLSFLRFIFPDAITVKMDDASDKFTKKRSRVMIGLAHRTSSRHFRGLFCQILINGVPVFLTSGLTEGKDVQEMQDFIKKEEELRKKTERQNELQQAVSSIAKDLNATQKKSNDKTVSSIKANNTSNDQVTGKTAEIPPSRVKSIVRVVNATQKKTDDKPVSAVKVNDTSKNKVPGKIAEVRASTSVSASEEIPEVIDLTGANSPGGDPNDHLSDVSSLSDISESSFNSDDLEGPVYSSGSEDGEIHVPEDKTQTKETFNRLYNKYVVKAREKERTQLSSDASKAKETVLYDVTKDTLSEIPIKGAEKRLVRVEPFTNWMAKKIIEPLEDRGKRSDPSSTYTHSHWTSVKLDSKPLWSKMRDVPPKLPSSHHHEQHFTSEDREKTRQKREHKDDEDLRRTLDSMKRSHQAKIRHNGKELKGKSKPVINSLLNECLLQAKQKRRLSRSPSPTPRKVLLVKRPSSFKDSGGSNDNQSEKTVESSFRGLRETFPHRFVSRKEDCHHKSDVSTEKPRKRGRRGGARERAKREKVATLDDSLNERSRQAESKLSDDQFTISKSFLVKLMKQIVEKDQPADGESRQLSDSRENSPQDATREEQKMKAENILVQLTGNSVIKRRGKQMQQMDVDGENRKEDRLLSMNEKGIDKQTEGWHQSESLNKFPVNSPLVPPPLPPLVIPSALTSMASSSSSSSSSDHPSEKGEVKPLGQPKILAEQVASELLDVPQPSEGKSTLTPHPLESLPQSAVKYMPTQQSEIWPQPEVKYPIAQQPELLPQPEMKYASTNPPKCLSPSEGMWLAPPLHDTSGFLVTSTMPPSLATSSSALLGPPSMPPLSITPQFMATSPMIQPVNLVPHPQPHSVFPLLPNQVMPLQPQHPHSNIIPQSGLWQTPSQIHF